MAIQDLFFRDFWWKFLAFVLATLIWANFGGKLNDRIELESAHLPALNGTDLNVKVQSTPMIRAITALRGPEITEGMRIEPAEATIIVRVDTSRSRVPNAKQILAFVDVTDMNDKQGWAATTRRTSRVVQVSLPPGVELVSVEPKSVIVERAMPMEAPATDSKTK